MKAETFQAAFDNATFGEIEVLLCVPREFSVVAAMLTDCLELHKRDLLHILAEFPATAEKMEKDARHAFKSVRRTRDQFREKTKDTVRRNGSHLSTSSTMGWHTELDDHSGSFDANGTGESDLPTAKESDVPTKALLSPGADP